MFAVALAVACFVMTAPAESKVDYCRSDTFNNSGSWLQFTKEISSHEYGIETKFKSLHCCAAGYNSIEWYKDGRPYPWPASTSSLILYPESANQTIYTQAAQDTDAGNYSCLVRNDTHTLQHRVRLVVQDSSGYSGPPLATYRPEDQAVTLGEDARLFCEAFVGRIDLPDAHNEVVWLRNGTALPTPHKRYTQLNVVREDNLILGSYLYIQGLHLDDLGEYVCRISNTGFQAINMCVSLHETEAVKVIESQRIPYNQLFLIIGIVILSAITLVTIYLRFGTQVRLVCKDMFGPQENDDGRKYDVLVCYHEKDSEFALGVLIPMLENHFGYQCCSQTYSFSGADDEWCREMLRLSEQSRRLLAVLSPAVVGKNWTSIVLTRILHTLVKIHPHVLCTALQALPKEGSTMKNEYGESLNNMCSAARVIVWHGNGDRARREFWEAVRLELPARRPHSSCGPTVISANGIRHQGTHVTAATPVKRTVRSNSHESLEVLV